MGKPGESHVSSPFSESIGETGPTGRTETSKYPQEKKSKRDSPSSGERTGKSPNRVFGRGVVGSRRGLSRLHVKSSGSGLERPAREGESPVCERLRRQMAWIPEYGGTRGIPSESGGTTLQG